MNLAPFRNIKNTVIYDTDQFNIIVSNPETTPKEYKEIITLRYLSSE